MSGKDTLSEVNRRQVVATVAAGTGLLAMPAILRAQSPLTVNFVQQRGLLYLPVDEMVSGGILQQEATKLGLGKIEATVNTLSGPAPVIDALLSEIGRLWHCSSAVLADPMGQDPRDAERS